MELSGSWSASSRRAVVVMGLAAMLFLAPGLNAQGQTAAQDPAQQQQQQAPQPDALKFTTDNAVVYNFVAPGKAMQFEESWAEIKAKLASSDKQELKDLATSLRMFKVDAPSPEGTVYLFVLEPASKTESYNPIKILYESGAWTRDEAEAAWGKLKDCYKQIQPWPLIKIG
jgi:hypothetical protein